MNGKEKKILFTLIFIIIVLIGMIVCVNAMVAKFGIVTMPIYLFVWLILLWLYVICIQKLRNKYK